MRKLPLYLICLFFSVSASAAVVATVNGRPITSEALALELRNPDGAALSPDQKLNNLILFELALEDAKKVGLDKDPAVRREMDKVLYKSYVDRAIRLSRTNVEPSDGEMKPVYEKYPLVRLRHLVIRIAENNPEPSLKRLQQIESKLKQGEDFQKLIIEYSDDESAAFGGDLDFRGVNNLNPDFYDVAIKLKPMEVSHAIRRDGGYHLFQLISKKPYNEAFPVYLSYLKSRVRAARVEKLLNNVLTDLKSKAKIEYRTSR